MGRTTPCVSLLEEIGQLSHQLAQGGHNQYNVWEVHGPKCVLMPTRSVAHSHQAQDHSRLHLERSMYSLSLRFKIYTPRKSQTRWNKQESGVECISVSGTSSTVSHKDESSDSACGSFWAGRVSWCIIHLTWRGQTFLDDTRLGRLEEHATHMLSPSARQHSRSVSFLGNDVSPTALEVLLFPNVLPRRRDDGQEQRFQSEQFHVDGWRCLEHGGSPGRRAPLHVAPGRS